MKTIDDVEIGEEYEHEGFVYLKFSEDEGAIIYDVDTLDWKRAKEMH